MTGDATPDRAAKFYCAVLRCEHCDRIPPHHRCVDGIYYCDDDPETWAVTPHRRLV